MTRATLDDYFKQVDALLLQRQDPVTGLFPASTAVTVHGDYTDAWVRDNVYSVLAAWALGKAYRRAGTDSAKAYWLEQTVVKLMRGLLLAMMKQSAKVERFKQTQDPKDALHAKYNTRNAETVVADDKWGHLQLDATSLYVLMLAQMSKGGLRLIFTRDEVAFVQNLVHYIGRAYRTPDYGIWERGHKINNGKPEINASSVGMAKAALQAIRGLNLFGDDGDEWSCIYVVDDEIARSRAALNALLPRESLSKEVDAALLSIIGFPAFAIDDPQLAARTRDNVTRQLAGPYGLKRFLLDGHQTVIEDVTRLHYEDDELHWFAHIESEWPLFYCYLMLEALFRGDQDAVQIYRQRLHALRVQKDGQCWLPELYFVPSEKVEAERRAPGSQERLPNHNVPLIWAQSLFLVAELLADGWLLPEDIDPVRRHQAKPTREVCVNLGIVADNEAAKKRLQQAGIHAQTTDELDGVVLAQADVLARYFQRLGQSEKLGLSGRPYRRLRSMATARVYQLDGELHVFFGQLQNAQSFYLAFDNRLLLTQAKAELSYIARHWEHDFPPLMLFHLPEISLDADGAEAVLDGLREWQSGLCGNVRVNLMTPAQAIAAQTPLLLAIRKMPETEIEQNALTMRAYSLPFDRAASASDMPEALVEKQSLSTLKQALFQCDVLPQQLRYVQAISRYYGLDVLVFDTDLSLTYRDLVRELYFKAGSLGHWGALRLAAGLLDCVHAGLEDAVTELIARQRQVVFGRALSSYVTVSKPLANDAVHALMRSHSGRDPRECLLNQEILIYLMMLVRANPSLLQGLLSIRSSYLLLLIISEVASEKKCPQDEAFDILCAMAPYAVLQRLKNVLEHYQDSLGTLVRSERLHYRHGAGGINLVEFNSGDDPLRTDSGMGWRQWRERAGVVGRHPEGFFADIWQLLKHCQGIMLGDRFEKHNLIEAKAVHDATTPGEAAFAVQFENLMNELSDPAYRSLHTEALMAISAVFRANPNLQVQERLVMDAILSYAVKLQWLDAHPEYSERYNEHRATAWNVFYDLAPHQVANAVVRAIVYLLEEQRDSTKSESTISDECNR